MLARHQPTWFLILIAGLTVALDQVTKWLVATRLALFEGWMPFAWLEPYFIITHTHNTGAAFGIFPRGGLFFTMMAIVVSFAIVYYFHQLPTGTWWVRVALGLQLGGALGNLVDRFRQGYVTDFIRVLEFPVFNLADSAIVVGVSILMVLMFLEDRRTQQCDDPQSEPDLAG